MTVPLDQIIALCAFNGDLDKIARYLCQKDVEKEADEVREEPPNFHLAPCEGVAAPSRMARMLRRSSSRRPYKIIISGSSTSTSNGKNK